MDVPRMIVAVGNFRPVHFDDASSRFDEAAGQQAALTKGILAVLFSKLIKRSLKFDVSHFVRVFCLKVHGKFAHTGV